ncbi:SDR family oxidoreductase [Virgisporangium aurantiacum]|uniref:NAD(P)-dependent oxidoreductase n=1 Tax=Virgisporangium aurantiacum TaxID=175570 RepID=A0A8J4E268_9ACTN|nr:SDR family oxidoreductase [Virgisporangium aurantiacum]GIJ58588.1 NAD(P)-dependent oxidoreductase [Virgisporangium aurantiacum]
MILVTGATGSIGRALVRHLAAGGVEVRAFVRDAERGAALGVPYTVGDLDEPGSLDAALDGVTRLFLNSGGAVPADGEQPMVRQQKAAIDAAVRAGVRRIVKVSVEGARPGGRLAQGAHWEIERHLTASTVDRTVLRPNGFMQNFVTGAGSFTADGDLIGHHTDAPVSYVDARDIAEVAAALLTGDHESAETLVLTGPEALTQTAIAAQLSTVAGRRVGFHRLRPAEMAEALRAQGLPAPFADDVAALWAEVAEGALAGVTDTVPRILGRPARSFAEFATDHSDELRSRLTP